MNPKITTTFWLVNHISREANSVINKIAKLVYADMVGVDGLTTTPAKLLKFIDREKANCAFDIVRLA